MASLSCAPESSLDNIDKEPTKSAEIDSGMLVLNC